MPSPLSAVIITRNAAAQLPECLMSVEFCDEILVVDSGSTDGTVEMARRHGARVIETHWRGFGPQKQFAVEQATHDWVLCIDADERVSNELGGSIRAVLPAPTFAAYRFARCNRFMGRYLRHGEGYPDRSLRLFDRRQARWSADAVHEKVLTDAPVGAIVGDLYHDSAESLENYIEKQNRYSTLAANAALAAGRRGSVTRLLFSPLLRFIKFYFLRAGFLDGVPGLVHILIGCYASFAKHAKMLAGARN
ncbi:MAG: glycosyltransferase family 2 protein [Pseudomonadota bacterium]